MNILGDIFLHPFPWDWFVQDCIVLLLSLFTVMLIAKREQRPSVTLLEGFSFIFLYAMIYENAAGVAGSYTFGRSVVMFGYVPASIPLIEVVVLLTGLWMLDKTTLPAWTKPLILGMFGMLQDLSLDPLAIRQIHEAGGVTSARWNWLVDATTNPSILGVPTFNFAGWMLIMAYSSAMLLVGRWVFKKSGYNRWVGYIYPSAAMLVALMIMTSPISSFLVALSPILGYGTSGEWIMLAVNLAVPAILLVIFARRGARQLFTRDDLPLFLIPMAMHLSDFVFAIVGGHHEILWLTVLSTAAHALIFFAIYAWNRASYASGKARMIPA